MLKQGYKVITENIEENPRCPHGPTLIFQRLVDGKPSSRTFYACSACRDRKDCNFFLWCDETLSAAAKNAWVEEEKKNAPQSNLKSQHEDIVKFMMPMTKCKESKFFCHSCLRLIEEHAVNTEHKGHRIQGNIGIEQLKFPTKLLQAHQDASKEAQFFFTDSSLKCLENILLSLNASTVISVGTPRLAEYVKHSHNDIDVLLLDLDWRYSIFYGDRFCWYNMFNHHFFGMEGDPNGKLNKQRYQDFLTNVNEEGSIVIVLDPPFGGRVEALAQTLHRIEKEIRDAGRTENIYYLWIYPYFMESYIKAELPESEMLDYKINYTNHPDYNQESKQGLKQGSPVRIFTNAPSNIIILPTEEGYYLCSKCQKYVSRENKHCNLCKACTSKDGRTYVHCKKCRRCVKPTWRHCIVCQRCCLINHKCNANVKIVTKSNLDGSLPQLHNETKVPKKHKRHQDLQLEVNMKKRKLINCPPKSLLSIGSKKQNKANNAKSKKGSKKHKKSRTKK